MKRHKFEVVRSYDNLVVGRFNSYEFAYLCAKDWGSFSDTTKYYVREAK